MYFLAGKFLAVLLLITITVEASNRKHKTNSYGDIVADQEEGESRSSYTFGDNLFKSRRFRFPDDVEDVGNRDREFTVGAHYSVASAPVYHPHNVKPSYENSFRKYSSSRQLSDDYLEIAPRHSKSKKHKKTKLFKPAQPAYESILDEIKPAENDDEFRIRDPDPRDFKGNFKLQDVPNLYDRESNFRSVASAGQIEQYLEDQQKYIDEAIELQLLNDPSPSAKGRYHQFLKAKDDERIEKEYIEKFKKDSDTYQHSTPKFVKEPFDTLRTERKPSDIGLGYYRNPIFDGSYAFELDI